MTLCHFGRLVPFVLGRAKPAPKAGTAAVSNLVIGMRQRLGLAHARPPCCAAEPAGKLAAELLGPAPPHRLIAELNPAGRQHLLEQAQQNTARQRG